MEAMRGRRPTASRSLGVLGLAVCAVCVCGPEAEAQRVTGEQVKRAVQRGAAYLRSRQAASGHWPRYSQPGGTTALSVVALLNAGVSRDDASLQRGLRAILATPNVHTYVVALKIMALATADQRAYAAEIQTAADWLADTQLKNGAWTYGRARGGAGDHSNTQFALLGLHEAKQAGAKVSQDVWGRAEKHWTRTQRGNDGGWGYSGGGPSRPTGSMTAAGVASLYIVGNSLTKGRERGFTKDGRGRGCGQYAQNKPIAAGIGWLTRNFTVRSNPGHRGWHLYYLYGLERVGMLTGFSRFGRHDWYREGAAYLVGVQQANGSWQNQVHETAFALLFLGKGHRSILINKLRWCRGNDWQPDRNDVAHLTGWLGGKLDQPVTWQVVDLDDPIETWLAAPILYFNGHRFPRFSRDDAKKLRRFVELGGTILAEACCGRKAFVDGMRSFAAEHFGEWPLGPLEPDHPIYHAMYELEQADFELEGISLGCRTSILFSPRDLSCLWEQGNLPVLSERAFKMGANIAAYATGREPLQDRLTVVRLPIDRPEPDRVVRGGLQIGQVVHKGDWRPDPHALPNLAKLLNEQANVDVVTRPKPIRLAEPTLFEHPIIYMVGHFDFALTQAERDNLKRFCQRGGFLFAEACCGRKAFDTAFRRLMGELFGREALKPLDDTHPILSGKLGYDISRVTYRPAVQREQPDLTQPMLEGVELQGRTAVVYSPYGFGCGLEGHKCYHCRGYAEADAKRVAVNIVLYALSY